MRIWWRGGRALVIPKWSGTTWSALIFEKFVKDGCACEKNFVRTRDPKISAPLRFGIARAFLSIP
jgi:hypothetical protein